MTLKISIEAVVRAGKAKDEARERWMALLSEGDSAQMEARRRHLALDDEYEALVSSLVETLAGVRVEGMLDLQMAALTGELRQALSHIASERGFREMLEPVRITDLNELVSAWRNAAHTLDAAQRLNVVRQMSEPESFESACAEERKGYRNPEAFDRAIAIFETLIEGADEGTDEGDRMAEAAYATIRRARRSYDALCEQLQGMLEEANDRGMLDYVLADLDPEEKRAVRDAIAGGFIRQRQAAPEPRAESRPVALLDEEESAIDPDSDFGSDPDFAFN